MTYLLDRVLSTTGAPCPPVVSANPCLIPKFATTDARPPPQTIPAGTTRTDEGWPRFPPCCVQAVPLSGEAGQGVPFGFPSTPRVSVGFSSPADRRPTRDEVRASRHRPANQYLGQRRGAIQHCSLGAPP